MLLIKVLSVFQLTCLGAACISGYWLYWELTTGRRRRQLGRKHGCRPAKRIKTTDPILGLDLLFKSTKWTQHHTLLENIDKLLFSSGHNTVEFNFLRHIAIFTTDAENAKTALSLNFRSYELPDMPKEIDMLLGGGIFTSEGQAWHQSRELLRPCFARSQVADLDMLEKHASSLIGKIPRDGSTIDLSRLFSQFTLSVAIEFLFGDNATKGNSDGEIRSNDAFAEVWDRLSGYLGGKGEHLVMMLMRYVRVNPRFKRDCRMIHDYVDTLIERSLSAKPQLNISTSRYLFLQELVSQTSDKTKIRAEALSVLLAGRDTTAGLLTNVFFELARRPDVWARLSLEVSTLNGQKPSYEQLKNMKYLRAVLNESQRIRPLVPGNGRQAREDTVLPLGGGEDGKSPILVKKGQLVIFATYSMHRRKDLYGEDADVFRPERWLDTEDQKGLRMGWEYLPFSGGARVCIGQNFALTEASYMTIRLVQEFHRLENRDPEPWRENFTLICGSLGGCKVGLLPGEGGRDE